MRSTSLLLSALVVFSAPNLQAQQVPQRDSQALVLLQRAVTAMAPVAPTDSAASGTITIVAGGETQTGTVRILTRGTDQFAELMQTDKGSRSWVVSGLGAREQQGASSKNLSVEAALSGLVPFYPLPLLAGALANPDSAFILIGEESLDGTLTYHVRLWNTFASNAEFQNLAAFSVKDVWLDAATGLPRRLTCERRDASGSAERARLAVSYSDYRNIGGVLYPFHIEKSLNGTPWQTITLQSVAFNTGLTDADFPVQR